VAPDNIAVAANALSFDFPVMIAVAIACLPIFFNGYAINRWEGGVFVAYYALYTTYLVMHSNNAPWLGALQQAMLMFVLPLTVITLLVIGAQAWKRHKQA
jgi:cation:H+ antiporter